MSSGGSKAPEAPNPTIVARQQAGLNRDAAVDSQNLNAINQYTPYGSVTYQFGDRGNLKNIPIGQTVTLSRDGQTTVDNQQRAAADLSGRAVWALNKAPNSSFSLKGIKYGPNGYDTSGLDTFDPNGMPYDPRSYGDVSQIDQKAADAAYNYGARKLDARFETQNRRMTNDLNNRGLPITGEAAGKVMSELNDSQNAAYGDLSNQSYLTGHQTAGDNLAREQGLHAAAFNEALQGNNQQYKNFGDTLQFEQNLRNSAINERERVRNAAINDASIYLQGAPAIQAPQANAAPSYAVQNADITNPTYNSYNSQMASYNQRQQSLWQGVGQLAGAGASMWMMSDANSKHDIGAPDRILRAARGLKIRTWRYKPAEGLGSELHVGPFAQEYAGLFGGPDNRIHLGDAIFTLWKAVQELADKVDALERK